MMSDLGLTVYGPEVARSGLTAHLDDFIHQQRRLEIVERFFSVHSRASINAFYSLTGSTGGMHWPLVLDLFDMRPACTTIWSGPDALSSLQKLKGNTQPAKAAPGTMRSRFYCDNPVTNLIHVSDSENIMAEELVILRNQSTGKVDEGWRRLNVGQTSHSSLLVLLRLLGATFIETSGCDCARTNAIRALEQARSLATANGIREPVEDYLAGHQGGLDQLLVRFGNISAWDHLILQAGLFAMPVWSSVLDARPTQQTGVGT
ncbi:nucleoside-diphosphate kinase [Rhizobium mongolense]|uniref:nucleoside-diphosphate kinase n=1 Tax=Rhizobium mongolense TaxID=57676 RepID=UPI0034A3E885